MPMLQELIVSPNRCCTGIHAATVVPPGVSAPKHQPLLIHVRVPDAHLKPAFSNFRFFDIFWIHFHPIRRLLFYNHPCSEAEFSNTILPNLKHTLSLTLQHFLPVAGNLLYPLHTGNFRPLIRYVSGRDFDELTGSHIRESDLLPHAAEEGNYKIAPLAAMQVTLFPCRGICVGLSNHHCLGDARSVPRFISAQAEMSIHNGDKQYLSCSSSLLFDKSVLGDANGADEKYWCERDHIIVAVESASLDPIMVMIEHILVRMARLHTRMDEYDRRQSSLASLALLEARIEASEQREAIAQPPPRPEPDPPDSDWQRGKEDTTRHRAVLTRATGVSSHPQLGFGDGPASRSTFHANPNGNSPWDRYGDYGGGQFSHGLHQTSPWDRANPTGQLQWDRDREDGIGVGQSSREPHHASPWDRDGPSGFGSRSRLHTAWDNPTLRPEIRSGRPAWDGEWGRLEGGGYSDTSRVDHVRFEHPRYDTPRLDQLIGYRACRRWLAAIPQIGLFRTAKTLEKPLLHPSQFTLQQAPALSLAAMAPLDDETAREVIRQVEFYFSDNNLPRDNFLMKTISESEDGMVSLSLLCSFSRMKGHLSLGDVKPEDVSEVTVQAVAETLKTSTFLKISDDGKKVGRVTELPKPEEVIKQADDRTIDASPLAYDVKLEQVESFFSHNVKVHSVWLPRHAADNRLLCGTTLIEFSSAFVTFLEGKKVFIVEVESSSLDPIKVMIEHILARMARLQTRMDEYDRRQSSRHTLRPDPEPPHSRAHSRPLEGPLPFTQPFAAVSVTTPPPPANAAFLGPPKGFRPNPSCASGPFRAGFTPQQSSTWELPPTSRERNSTWELPPSTRSQQLQPWGNRFPDHQSHNGHEAWDQLGQRQPAPPPPTYEPDPYRQPHSVPPEQLAYFGLSSYVQQQDSATEYHSWVHQQLPPQPVLDQPSPQQQLESGSQSILSVTETCVLLNEDTDECIADAKDDHSDVKNFFKYTKGEGKQLFRELDKESEWQLNSSTPLFQTSNTLSLSLTLKHYLPVATNLLYPLHTDASKPAFRYISGDFIPLTIAVSSLDFDELVANHAKESDQLYAGAGDPAG
ncbi:hypothetical protein SASPL_124368 [Salvia splendens]|uniref:HTH La-type RNA-binding domain-containing protein n=1 Tax=Salvia splendens TaxID=180675 RepID=A0A8X8ZSU6_SALSN|nr:hypothetical protein SASPL_124368 [Salvia splendens]